MVYMNWEVINTQCGSELGLHWVLGPKNSKFGQMGPKFLAQKFLYTKLVIALSRYPVKIGNGTVF